MTVRVRIDLPCWPVWDDSCRLLLRMMRTMCVVAATCFDRDWEGLLLFSTCILVFVAADDYGKCTSAPLILLLLLLLLLLECATICGQRNFSHGRSL